MSEERWEQPGICVCQGNDPHWHAHYGHGEHGCARCSACHSWRPAIRPLLMLRERIRTSAEQVELTLLEIAADWQRLADHLGVERVPDATDEVFHFQVEQALRTRSLDYVQSEMRGGYL